jgi:transposase
MRIGRSTIERWYYKALGNLSDPLSSWTHARSDKGSFPSVSRRVGKILDCQYKRHPGWEVGQHFQALRKKLHRVPTDSLPSYTSIYRYIQNRSGTDEHVSIPNKAHVEQLTSLISHLRRIIIIKSVFIYLLENGCSRRRLQSNKIKWSWLSLTEKQYVLHALEKYRRAGGSFLQFCNATNISTATIERWLSAYKADGLNGLVSRKPRHKRVISSQEKTNRLLEIFHSTPLTHGINRTSWTGDALAEAYAFRSVGIKRLTCDSPRECRPIFYSI